jgi:hypothetical protein
MKSYKITNRTDSALLLPGSVGISLGPQETIVVRAKEFSLALLNSNKLFTLEELKVATVQAVPVKLNEPRARSKKRKQAPAVKSPVKSSKSDEKKVSEDG